MNYQLNQTGKENRKTSVTLAVRGLMPYLKNEKRNLYAALAAILVTSAATLVAPLIIAHTVDAYIQTKDYSGVLIFSGLLLAVYVVNLVSSYLQTKLMGGVGRRVLFSLRNAVFDKLQALPVAFFNENKAGDLISRINNDTDQLNQFFSQALMQFVRNAFLIVGAAAFLLVLDSRLGGAALIPAVCVLIVTQILSVWVKRANLKSLQSLGGLSAEIQESINNFKVVVAFNRLDYFKRKFAEANEKNFKSGIVAGLANSVFTPIYGLASNTGLLIVLGYGIYLISLGQLTVGLLIGFILYANGFYSPLQQLASVWPSLQTALAGFDRISEVLNLESNMPVIVPAKSESAALLEFRNVSFGYPDGKDVLRNINLKLEKGKTYALVGPTGGGKTTTASLMARLYDPTKGVILLDGRDIRSYDPAERSMKIGFILQEPFLFSGTVRENIIYGNDAYRGHSSDELRDVLEKTHLSTLLARFESGLDTPVTAGGDAISLGQKQLIAFIRAVLRKPEILILDEATANIDTVTEQLLEDILENLPKETTKVIIAHRLNTIDSADAICFVNGGDIVLAGSMESAVDMLMHGKRQS